MILRRVIGSLWLLSVTLLAEIIPVMRVEGLEYHSHQTMAVAFKPREKAMAVVFLSAKCGCSQSYYSELSNLSIQFPNVDFVGIHANADEMTPEYQKVFETRGPLFPVIQDSRGTYLEAFNVLKTPHVFLYNSQGTLMYEGGIADSKFSHDSTQHYFKSALESITSGETPRVSSYRTLGCAIARPH